GFATGSFVGLWIEEKLAFGLATVRIISTHGGVELAEALRDRGFGVTEFSGQGRHGPVEVVYTVLRRRQIPEVLEEVDRWDPQAFVTVEEPRQVRAGWQPMRRREPPARAGFGFPDRRSGSPAHGRGRVTAPRSGGARRATVGAPGPAAAPGGAPLPP